MCWCKCCDDCLCGCSWFCKWLRSFCCSKCCCCSCCRRCCCACCYPEDDGNTGVFTPLLKSAEEKTLFVEPSVHVEREKPLSRRGGRKAEEEEEEGDVQQVELLVGDDGITEKIPEVSQAHRTSPTYSDSDPEAGDGVATEVGTITWSEEEGEESGDVKEVVLKEETVDGEGFRVQAEGEEEELEVEGSISIAIS